MTSALIGHTGFVGSSLAAAERFDLLIHRANLEELRGRQVDRLVCAGLPAAKWMANREPEADRTNMERLCEALGTVQAKKVVLISTVDVYPRTQDADELFEPRGIANHPYGQNRLALEEFVRSRFPSAHIIRLPALFGYGLKKNVLFDLLHDNGLDAINPDSRFQWYALAQLPVHIRLIEETDLPVVNLVPEPVETRAILKRFFPSKRVGAEAAAAVTYDLRTRHSRMFGGPPGYIMTAPQVMDVLGRFLANVAPVV